MHIPKCGGTSLLRALRKWFWRWRVIEHYPKKGERPTAVSVKGKMCVHGHFHSRRARGVMNLYPQAHQFITFLRDPFDRFVSLWHFLPAAAARRGETEWERPDFETFLKRSARQQRAGRSRESLIWYFPQPPGVEDISTQMDHSFVFVGVMERYQESLDALAAVLGKRRVRVSHLNQTERTNDYEEWRPFYREHFANEYAVYEAALKRNDELLKRYL